MNAPIPIPSRVFSFALRRLFIAIGGLGWTAPVVLAQANEVNIGVRTKVMDGWVHPGWKRPAEGGHSKIYGILSVEEVKNALRLVKPVDEKLVLQILSAEMNKNGFKLYAPGQKPDILITCSYGRGEMQNPYIRDTGEAGGDYRAGANAKNFGSPGGSANDSGATTVVVTGMFDQLLEEKQFGYEAKLQKASQEKLFIRVTGWAYPTAKTKAKMLWKTIIVADDPDNRDLNTIVDKLLAAGAPYFDKEIKEPEIDSYKPVPDGHVNVGAPEVVDRSKAK